MGTMSAAAHALSARFVLYWTAVTAAGLTLSLGGVALGAAGMVGIALVGPTPAGLANFALILFEAPALALTTSLGISQSVVLRRARLEMRFWIPATTIGFIAGAAAALAGLSISPMRGENASLLPQTLRLLAIAGEGALLGAPIGIAQWLILRQRFKRSGLWIVGTTAGTAVALAFAGALGSLLPDPWAPPGERSLLASIALLLLPVLFGSVLFGATTGLLLRRLVAVSHGGERPRRTMETAA